MLRASNEDRNHQFKKTLGCKKEQLSLLLLVNSLHIGIEEGNLLLTLENTNMYWSLIPPIL
jgi:hypothetical protein